MPPRSRTKQLLVLTLGGFVLAFGGCLLFVAQVESNSTEAGMFSVIGAIIFFGGAVMFAIGGISAIVIGLTKLFGGKKAPADLGAPPDPGAPPSQA